MHLQGQRLEKSLRDLFNLHEHVGDIRGRGLFYALEFLQDRERKTPFDPGLQVHERVKDEALQRGLAIYPHRKGSSMGAAAITSSSHLPTSAKAATLNRLSSASAMRWMPRCKACESGCSHRSR